MKKDTAMFSWLPESTAYIEWFVAVAGALAALWAAIRGLIRISKTMDQVLENSEYIQRELRPNGGGSLRDAVNRIDHRVDTINERQQRSELRLAALNMNAPHGIIETNVDGDCVWVNRTFCRWAGRTVVEFMGAGWLNTVQPRHRERVETAWSKAVEDGSELEICFCVQDTYGEVFPVHLIAHPLRDNSGGIHGHVASLTQIFCTSDQCDSCDFGSLTQTCKTKKQR